MQRRRLGKSDLNVSRIGIGTWPLGGTRGQHGWGPQSDADSLATLQAAFEGGVNWIDTAPAYGLGHAESIVGKALRGRRDTLVVATKCGLVWSDGERHTSACLRPTSIRTEVEASLRRLGIEVIDLYQIHWPSPREQLEDAWRTIANLIAEGKVRYAGASNFNLQQLEGVRSIHPVTTLQMPYNMIERGIEREMLSYCASHDIAILAYRPLYAGLLGGTFTAQRRTQLAASDWRARDANFQAPLLTINLALAERLADIAARLRVPSAAVAVAWTLRSDAVTASLVGARQPQQLASTLCGAQLALPDEITDEIDELLAARDSAARELRRSALKPISTTVPQG